MTRHTTIWIGIALALLVQTPAGASEMAIWPFKKKKADTEKVDTVKTPSKYEKLFKKEQKKAEGFITVHLKEGKVYFEIPDSVFGRDLLLGSTVKSISDNGNGIVGSKENLIHFTFVKRDSTVYMRRLDSEYITDDANIERALSRSRTSYIMKKFPVKAYNADSTASVIDVTGVFLSDDKELSPFSSYAAYARYNRTDSFNKDLSFITDVKAFDDNLSVTSSLSYTYSLANAKTQKTVRKNAHLTAEVNRSIVMLPKKIYHPRTADPRIGFFFTERTKFAGINSISSPIYFVNRWRLEPSDTAAYRRGELVEPVKPITYYIDSDFPEWWKPYIREAVEQWNEVFEEIGFKNAIVAKDFPAYDPAFDPENIKYSCIRYAPIGIQNAMGPSWTDPRSGEIINASVYVYHDVIKLLTGWMFVQTAQADSRVRARDIPEDLLGDALMYVIKHEVGHTLGLMHNMSGSSVIPVDSLRSPSFTQKNGTTTSIMDYARFNYVAQPGDAERGVKLTPPNFGSYDRWAIRWGYKPVFDMPSFEAETEYTTKMISDSLEAAPFYRYGKQQMSAVLFDPSCQTEDLSDDVLKASELGISNLKYITAHFMDWVADSTDTEYEFRTSIYSAILNQYLRYIGHLMTNVGGLYKNEVIAGSPYPRFANVPGDKQKKIMEFVIAQYNDLDWLDSKEVLSKLPVIGKPSSAVRKSIASDLFVAPFLAGWADGISTYEYSCTECLDRVFDFVWKSSGKLTSDRKALQKDFVETYMAMAGFAMPGSKNALADEAEDIVPEELHIHRGCWDDSIPMGSLDYDPVSGFEWTPRTIFNQGSLTAGTVYAVLMKAYKRMQTLKASASEEDKAHYDYLMSTISYSLKNGAKK